MELIVIFNDGKDAARAGQPRSAPQSVKYPVVSQYHPTYEIDVSLTKDLAREWLRGYDA
jgi:hypothetical protein